MQAQVRAIPFGGVWARASTGDIMFSDGSWLRDLTGEGKPYATAEDYLREELRAPGLRVVSGFPPIMPSYQGLLSDWEVDAIMAYLEAGAP